MSFVTVYRVENANGNGPYQSKHLSDRTVMVLDRMWDAHCNMDHPSPWVEPELRGIEVNEICAFESIPQLRKWFSGYGKDLEECDFKVKAFSVDPDTIRRGRYQCLIPADTDKPTHTFNPTAVIR